MEKEIFQLLSQLRSIRPDKRWAIFNKRKILGQQEELFPFFKPIYGLLFFVLFLISVVQLAGKTPIVEYLYPIKELSHKTRELFLSPKDSTSIALDTAEKNAKELVEVVKKNDIRKLPGRIREFQANALQAARALETSKEDHKDLKKAFSIYQTIKSVEKDLGVEIAPREYEEVLIEKVREIIQELQNTNLDEKERGIVEKAKESLDAGNVEEALTTLLLINKY